MGVPWSEAALDDEPALEDGSALAGRGRGPTPTVGAFDAENAEVLALGAAARAPSVDGFDEAPCNEAAVDGGTAWRGAALASVGAVTSLTFGCELPTAGDTTASSVDGEATRYTPKPTADNATMPATDHPRARRGGGETPGARGRAFGSPAGETEAANVRSESASPSGRIGSGWLSESAWSGPWVLWTAATNASAMALAEG